MSHAHWQCQVCGILLESQLSVSSVFLKMNRCVRLHQFAQISHKFSELTDGFAFTENEGFRDLFCSSQGRVCFFRGVGILGSCLFSFSSSLRHLIVCEEKFCLCYLLLRLHRFQNSVVESIPDSSIHTVVQYDSDLLLKTSKNLPKSMSISLTALGPSFGDIV